MPAWKYPAWVVLILPAWKVLALLDCFESASLDVVMSQTAQQAEGRPAS
jgi:hypothetical protein